MRFVITAFGSRYNFGHEPLDGITVKTTESLLARRDVKCSHRLEKLGDVEIALRVLDALAYASVEAHSTLRAMFSMRKRKRDGKEYRGT